MPNIDRGTLPCYVSKYAVYWSPLEVADTVGALKTGLKIAGVSGSVTLPANTAKTFTAEYASGGGTIEVPTKLNREAASIQIPIMSYGSELFSLPSPGSAVLVQLRSEIVDLLRFGIPKPDGFTFIYRGLVKERNPGNAESGNGSQANFTVSVFYEEIFQKMKQVYAYDWINAVEIENGVPKSLTTSIFT